MKDVKSSEKGAQKVEKQKSKRVSASTKKPSNVQSRHGQKTIIKANRNEMDYRLEYEEMHQRRSRNYSNNRNNNRDRFVLPAFVQHSLGAANKLKRLVTVIYDL